MRLFISLLLVLISGFACYSQKPLSDKTVLREKYSLNTIPDTFVFSRDRQHNLTKSIDSILCIRITDTPSNPAKQPLITYTTDSISRGVIAFHKCTELTYFSYECRRTLHKQVDFKNFPNLLEIKLNNFIREGDLETIFKTAKNLRAVSIPYDGYLDALPPAFFQLSDLEYLEIGAELLQKMNPDCLASFKKLKFLKIYRTTPTTSEMAFLIPSLEAVEFENGDMGTIPEFTSEVSHLKQITVRNIKSISFGGKMEHLKSLEYIHFELIKSPFHFPGSFNSLSELKGLILNEVKLSEFPDLTGCKNLIYIQFDIENCITPQLNVSNQQMLKSLSITIKNNDCKNYELPSGIETLISLEHFKFNVPVSELPSGFYSLPRFLYLDLIIFKLSKSQLDNLYSMKSLKGFHYRETDVLNAEMHRNYRKERGYVLSEKFVEYDFSNSINYYRSKYRDRIE
jgi:hypothetical protein